MDGIAVSVPEQNGQPRLQRSNDGHLLATRAARQHGEGVQG